MTISAPKSFPTLPRFPQQGQQQLILAGGCFWCVEGVLQRLRGVTEVESGYLGGTAETANYKAVCRGDTGHAEAVRVVFDAQQIDLAEILTVFFTIAHDPTQLNRQGADRGTQYRSALFYQNDAEREYFEGVIRHLDESGAFEGPIVTSIEPGTGESERARFYPAEDYHQNYAACNPYQPYIQGVALPKIEALRRHWPAEKLKAISE